MEQIVRYGKEADERQVSASFAFANTEGNVGEPLEMQVVLKSSAHLTSRPIQLSQIRIEFTAGLKNIIISNSAAPSQGRVNQAPQSSKQDIELRTSTGSTTQSSDPPGPNSSDLYGDADLVLFSGCTTALSASCIPRDAGEVFVGGITLDIKEEGFDFEISFDEDDQLQQDHFWVSTVSGVSPKSLKRGRSYAVNILPKPPKMQIGLLGILGSYFIDELVVLDISIANEEDETAEGILDVRLSGPAGPPPKLAWAGDQSQGNSLIDESSAAFIEDGSLRIPPSSLGSVAAGGELQRQLRISHVQQPTEYNLRIESRYSLKSDPETLITKIYTTDIVFIQPFEVSCAFTPQVHPDPWPNYFDPEDLDDNEASQTQSNKSVKASGLLQRWALFSRLHNLTPSDDLILDSITPIVHYIQDAVVHDVDLPLSDALSASTKVHPNSTHDRTHVLDVQKLTLDDRRPTTLDLDLRVIFHRPGSTATSAKAIQYGTDTITTQLPLPPLHLNYSEPRVLASLSFDRIAGQAETPLAIPKAPRPIHLTYTLENPSTYTLPFTVTMETPDTSSTSLPRQAKSPPQRRLSIGGSASAAPGALFAFSGPKAQSFHMLPLSRRELHYTILPFPSASSSTAPGSNSGGEQQAAPGMEGDRDTVVYPILRVIDRAFGKRLRVWPTAMLASNAVESSKAGGTEGGEVVLRADNRRGVGQAPGSGETAASGGSGIAIWISN